MESYAIAKIFSALVSVWAALHVRAEGFHLWAGLIGVAAASLLASYTFSLSPTIQWLA